MSAVAVVSLNSPLSTHTESPRSVSGLGQTNTDLTQPVNQRSEGLTHTPIVSDQTPAINHQSVPDRLSPVNPSPSNIRQTHSSGIVQLRELRRRIIDAVDLGRRAQSGDQAAMTLRDEQLAHEADPRVREALAIGDPPAGLGRERHMDPPLLPDPATRAESGEIHAYWVTPDSQDETYESSVTVDTSGRAMIETVHDAVNGERWHVRYPAWAYRDSLGRLVIDARGQPVEHLSKPEWGWWSPDSMVIGIDGCIDIIDDKRDPGHGTSGANGSG